MSIYPGLGFATEQLCEWKRAYVAEQDDEPVSGYAREFWDQYVVREPPNRVECLAHCCLLSLVITSEKAPSLAQPFQPGVA